MNIKVIILSLGLLLGHGASAQLHLGLSMYLDWNLYQWYQQPTTISVNHRSVGQVFNLIPSGGLGVWAGRSNSFLVSLEGGIDYAPYSFDLEAYGGLGAVSFPLLARGILPFEAAKGVSSFVGLGFGVQWSRNELYAYPKGQQPLKNPFFATLVVEVSLGLGAGWGVDDKKTEMFAVFSRVGFGSHYALTFNCGLRAKLLYNPMAKPKRMPSDKPKTYQVYLQHKRLEI